MKRTFIAIKIPLTPKIKTVFDEFRNTLCSENIKWNEENNLHITLFFNGGTDEKIINIIDMHLKEISVKCSNITLTIKSLGVFKNLRTPGVLWLGIMPNDELIVLQSIIQKCMNEFGFEQDKECYMPHLTLGRIKILKNPDTLKQLINKFNGVIIEEVQVNDFIFYESKLTPNGPLYSVLGKYRLNN